MSMFLLTVSHLLAGTCASDTLANYIALGATGCSVGPLTFSGFSFSVLSTGGTPLIVNASQINVTPLLTNTFTFGVDFSSSGFRESGNNFVNYSIGYTEDPEGPIQSLDDVLDDPVTPPGLGQVTTVGCLGAAFTDTTCPAATVSLTVFDAGTSSQLKASATFTGVSILGIQKTITLNGNNSGNPANTGGSVTINGDRSSSTFAPEPGTFFAGALGLAALILSRKPGLKLLQVGFQRRP
jgi:hypothetical protein